MAHNNGVVRCVASVTGLLFLAGTMNILFKDVLLHAAPLNLKHLSSLIIMFGTLLVGILAHKSWDNRHWLAFGGFTFLAVWGTALVVYSSVGRQSEATLMSAHEVEETAKRRADLKTALSDEVVRLTTARAKLAAECSSGKGRRCDGNRAIVTVYEDGVKGLEARLALLAPDRIAAPEAETLANIAHVAFGADKARVQAIAILAEPFLYTGLFELGTIICFGYAFAPAHRPRRRPVLTDTPPIPDIALPPQGSDGVVDWVQAFRDRHGRPPRLPEVQAAFPDLSRTTAWRRIKVA